MRAFTLLSLLVFSASTLAEFSFYKIQIELEMKGRKRVTRELVVQERQVSRINMAEPNEKKIYLEIFPVPRPRSKKTVRIQTTIYAEQESGELRRLGNPKIETKHRKPSSMNIKSLYSPEFDVRFTIDDYDVEPVFSNEADAIYYFRNEKEG